MKRIFGVLALFCVMLFPSAAMAGVVDVWKLSFNLSFSDVVWVGNDASNTWDTGDTLGWGDKAAGDYREFSFFDWHGDSSISGTGEIGAENNYSSMDDVSPALGYDFNMQDASLYTSLLSASVRMDLVLTPQNGGSSVNVSLEIPFYIATLDVLGDGEMSTLFIMKDFEWAPQTPFQQFVYDGMTYELNLTWYNDFPLHSSYSGLPVGEIRDLCGFDADQDFYGTWLWADTSEMVSFIELRSGEITPAAVPVPAAVWLFGTGLAGLAALKRRQR